MSITLTTPASNTYKLHYTKNKISGFTDRRNALEQSIYCLLNTERYKYVIYSFNYGIQREDLFGKSIDNAILKLQYRISNALNADDRINSVTDFEFEAHSSVAFNIPPLNDKVNNNEILEKFIDIIK